jgi:hypothetical protein
MLAGKRVGHGLHERLFENNFTNRAGPAWFNQACGRVYQAGLALAKPARLESEMEVRGK